MGVGKASTAGASSHLATLIGEDALERVDGVEAIGRVAPVLSPGRCEVESGGSGGGGVK